MAMKIKYEPAEMKKEKTVLSLLSCRLNHACAHICIRAFVPFHACTVDTIPVIRACEWAEAREQKVLQWEKSGGWGVFYWIHSPAWIGMWFFLLRWVHNVQKSLSGERAGSAFFVRFHSVCACVRVCDWWHRKRFVNLTMRFLSSSIIWGVVPVRVPNGLPFPFRHCFW